MTITVGKVSGHEKGTVKSSRRHDSLIPLSREHQYGLMLCLRIRQGLAARGGDPGWQLAKANDVISFFEGELTAHFKAEEEVLFPAMRELPGAEELIKELLKEHRTDISS